MPYLGAGEVNELYGLDHVGCFELAPAGISGRMPPISHATIDRRDTDAPLFAGPMRTILELHFLRRPNSSILVGLEP
nr:hypothetical protein CFP56_57006 [Quercus suber]